MRSSESLDRIIVCGLALCLLASVLSACMASAATTVLSQTVKTTAKAAGTAARVTMDGARATSRLVTRPFRKDPDETGEPVN